MADSVNGSQYIRETAFMAFPNSILSLEMVVRIICSPCHDSVAFVGINKFHINSNAVSKEMTRIHQSSLVSCGIFPELNTRHGLTCIYFLLLPFLFFFLRVLDFFITI